ncbi:MAG: primosomal protein N' [Bacteroidetes bacterium GWA2_31_9]|nr:MAG: primosomal protein N' [Bacteroidetes bacterium GWA2_31_9]
MNYYINVILPLSLSGTFTYNVPEPLISEISVGKRVVVQFGKRKIYSAIVNDVNVTNSSGYDIKDIDTVLDTFSIVNEIQLRFWDWIVQYYLCNLGEVMKAAIPAGLKLESKTNVIFNDEAEIPENLSKNEEKAILSLSKSGILSIDELNKNIGIKHSFNIIKSLSEKNLISIEEEVNQKFKPKFTEFIKLAENIDESQLTEITDKLSRAKKQQALLLKFLSETYYNETPKFKIAKSDLLSSDDFSSAVLKQLVEKQILEVEKIETGRLNFNETENSELNILNEFQQIAYNEINQKFSEKDVVLLKGVTSSGKTEIYTHLIQNVIDSGKQVLYLLPEIALTAQIINRLKKYFGNKVGIYHSKYSDSERVEVWNNLVKNDLSSYKIILGVRSSVFLPFSNLGLIIIDEEHENSYKQFDPAPRYNARDSAIVLASMHNSKVLLGTATPSYETYFNAQSGKFGYVELNSRYLDILLPKILVVNLKDAYKRKQMSSHFSDTLIQKIESVLAENEQVILFQNRRGFAPYMECEQCNWIPKCKYCDVSLTYHKFHNRLVCHYCGYSVNVINKCPSCENNVIKTRGFGTEKIEDEISNIFPNAKVGRLDIDTAGTKKNYESIIEKFENKQINILVGTQMITKGLDFDNVSLVGILNADNMLNFPDFRAFERSFQLMVQVSGRAGRKHKQGSVIIQTNNPEHEIIKQVVQYNYNQVFNVQMHERLMFKYPPYYRLISIRIKHRKIENLNAVAGELAIELRKLKGLLVIGPEFPLIARVQNFYLKNILIKLEKNSKMPFFKDSVLQIANSINKKDNFKSAIIILDVDPM